LLKVYGNDKLEKLKYKFEVINRMKELYYIRPYRRSLRTLRLEFGKVKNKFLLRLIDGEINIKGKSEFSPIEEVFNEEQEMLKNVWELRKQLSEEKWKLQNEEESPKIKQPSFISSKTMNGDLSIEFDN